MTYGMILLTVGISFFFTFLMTAFCVWRFNVRTRKMVEQVHILQDMINFNIKYLLHTQKNNLQNIPHIKDTLENTSITVDRILERADYGYSNVKISRQKKWFIDFIREFEKADDDTKELLSMNGKLINRVYKNKSPILFLFGTLKKNILLRILYGFAVIVVWLGSKDYKNDEKPDNLGKMMSDKMLQEA